MAFGSLSRSILCLLGGIPHWILLLLTLLLLLRWLFLQAFVVGCRDVRVIRPLCIRINAGFIVKLISSLGKIDSLKQSRFSDVISS